MYTNILKNEIFYYFSLYISNEFKHINAYLEKQLYKQTISHYSKIKVHYNTLLPAIFSNTKIDYSNQILILYFFYKPPYHNETNNIYFKP